MRVEHNYLVRVNNSLYFQLVLIFSPDANQSTVCHKLVEWMIIFIWQIFLCSFEVWFDGVSFVFQLISLSLSTNQQTVCIWNSNIQKITWNVIIIAFDTFFPIKLAYNSSLSKKSPHAIFRSARVDSSVYFFLLLIWFTRRLSADTTIIQFFSFIFFSNDTSQFPIFLLPFFTIDTYSRTHKNGIFWTILRNSRRMWVDVCH